MADPTSAPTEVANERMRQAQDARRAALNLLDDAVQARRHAEDLNEQLRDEIAERKRTETLLQRQKEALEMVAGGTGLDQVLDFLARAVERESPRGMMAAVHVISRKGTHFTSAVAPSLPALYREATASLVIDAASGPCCAAALSGDAVVVPDFAREARWPQFTELARRCGIRSGWSTPIVSTAGKVIGTFAMYYGEVRDPGPQDVQLLGIVTRTAALAIEHTRAAEDLRKSGERYRALFESIDEGFCIIEKVEREAGEPLDFRFIEANPGFSAHAGVDGVVGKSLQEVFPGEPEEWLRTFDDVATSGKPLRFEHALVRQGRVLELYAFRVDGGGHQVAVIFKDITQHKEHEHARSESDRRKNEFLAMLAHELRNPLAPILASIEILGRFTSQPAEPGLEGPSSATLDAADRRAAHALAVLRRQVGQMVRLVDDLLDAGRISRGKIDLRKERVELTSVVHHVLEAVRPISDRRAQTLTVTLPTVPVYLLADSTRLAQVVGNLLSNACKFTDRGGHIWLTVERDESATNEDAEHATSPRVAIRVRDTGIGIAAHELEHVFEMFTQVDTSLERSLTGLGIGLTLVKVLTEMHGGTVDVSSGGLGQGSEFVVRLPIEANSDEPAVLTTTVRPPTTRRLRMLVVDDNRDSADTLSLLLEFMGHEVHVAYDGLAAVEAAARIDPDVILLDIGLPGINGYEAARRIRAGTDGRRPVLIALTGWGKDEDRRRTAEVGFDAHVVKPVNDTVLAGLLAKFGDGEHGTKD